MDIKAPENNEKKANNAFLNKDVEESAVLESGTEETAAPACGLEESAAPESGVEKTAVQEGALQERRDEVAAILDRVMRLLRRGNNKTGLGRAAGRVLRTLMMAGAMTTRDLAKRLDVRISSLNETLKKLEEEGLIMRTRSEMDGRVYVLVLTTEGRRLAEKIRRDRLARERLMASFLTEEERAEFIRLAQKLVEGLEMIEKYEDINNWDNEGDIEKNQMEQDIRLTVMMQLAKCEVRALKNSGQWKPESDKEENKDTEEK